MTGSPKIFCLGFQKTGTTSLYAALTTLGYRVTGSVCVDWELEKLQAEGLQHCIDVMTDFDAAEDMPWPLFYRELDEAFPGSKFILTVRESESWFSSLDNHFGEVDTPLSALTYSKEFSTARGNKDRYIARYERHNAEVREYFKNRSGDFLEMSLADGDGWDELCALLGKSIPPTPFPAKNKSTDRKSLAYRLKRKFLLMTGQSPQPEHMV